MSSIENRDRKHGGGYQTDRDRMINEYDKKYYESDEFKQQLEEIREMIDNKKEVIKESQINLIPLE